MNNNITHLDNVELLIDRYQYFLVDQFGVLHDGYNAFAGAANALRQIKSAGGRVIIISNSGKRASSNSLRMNKLGFGDDCYDRLVSSGEVAWHLLKDQIIGKRIKPGASTYFLANDADRSAVEGLELTEVGDLNKAEIILLTGQLLDQNGLTDLCRRLASSVAREVLCVCTNPDKIAYGPNGKVFSSGSVAQWYEEQGGEVIWLGKPYREIYDFVLKQENITDKRKVICVGDSIEHDIAGGTARGLHTVLVRTGIADHVGSEELQSMFEKYRCAPSYIIQALSV